MTSFQNAISFLLFSDRGLNKHLDAPTMFVLSTSDMSSSMAVKLGINKTKNCLLHLVYSFYIVQERGNNMEDNTQALARHRPLVTYLVFMLQFKRTAR